MLFRSFQLTSMLRGVIERGTGARARSLGRAVFGKTGTTNDEKDAWFIGYTTDIVCGVYVGFDQPRTLGPKEQGATAALPIFIDFMKEALKQAPAQNPATPAGIVMARVRESDGALAEASENALSMPFKTGTVPTVAVPAAAAAPIAPTAPPTAQPAGFFDFFRGGRPR